MLKLISFFSFFYILYSQNIKSTFKDLVSQYLENGKMNNAYLSYDQFIDFINDIKENFPDKVNISSIGKTFEGRETPLITLKRKSTEVSAAKSGIFITGMIHGREPVSMMMNLYILLHLLSLPDELYEIITSKANIYFLPIINIDTYKLNCEICQKIFVRDKCLARKNRNVGTENPCRTTIEQGVDLNRNFGYYFGHDDRGSSDNKCEEDYRGPKSFSEPETQNIKKFLETHLEIKIALNYHTYGNLVITPFNYLARGSEDLIRKKFPVLFDVYNEFEKEALYPLRFQFGNGQKTIGYTANGDASDWMLGERGILSFSPELGSGDIESNNFYPDKRITFDVIQNNLPSALYAIQKAGYFLKGFFNESNYFSCKKFKPKNLRTDINICSSKGEVVFTTVFSIKNEGFSDYEPANDLIELNLNIELDNVTEICYGKEKENTFPYKSCSKIKKGNNGFVLRLNDKIASREQIEYTINFIISESIIKKVFIEDDNKDEEKEGEKDEKNPIITIDKVGTKYITEYANHSTDNEEKKFSWLFNIPEVKVPLNEIKQIDPNNYKKEDKHFVPGNIIISLFVMVFLIVLLYSIYLISKNTSKAENMSYVKTTSGSNNTLGLENLSQLEKSSSMEKYIELKGKPLPDEILPPEVL